MGLLDTFTGGSSEDAKEAMRKAQEVYANVQAPTQAQLTLPELQQYVDAGLMSPADAQAYLQTSNAYNTENIPQTGTAAQVQALNQLSGIANAGAEGTPVEQAQIQQAINQMNQAVGGQRGAIEQAAQARGTPGGLVQAALENQTVGQEAQQANQNALQAQAQAYQTALQAMTQGGALGGQLQGQQNTQANTVAGAQNAMQQFNAQNQQNASEANANRTQQANTYNTTNKQQVANENTGLANSRTAYNATVPETVFGNQMQKASGEAGAYQNIGNMANQQGQQNAGLASGLLNMGATVAGGMVGGPAGALAANQLTQPNGSNTPSQYNQEQNTPGGYGYAKGGIINPIPAHYDCGHAACMAQGGICMEKGGILPGHARVQGDSERNDHVPIMASPGESIIPRTETAKHMPEILNMLSGHSEPTPHPTDVATMLKAMRAIRMGAV